MIVCPTRPAEQQQLLWSTLYAGGRGYLALFSAVRPRGGAKRLRSIRSAYFEYPRRIEEALAWTRASSEAREAHFCPHLLTRRRRIKENAAPVRALWADRDEADLPEGLPEPTIVVESSPGRRHLYWALRSAVEPRRAENLNRRLTYAAAADPAGWPLATLLRLPGTLNHKYPESPMAEITVLDPTLSYHPRELELCLPEYPPPPSLDLGRQASREPGSAGSTQPADPSRLSSRIRNLIRDGYSAAGDSYKSRSEADFAVCIAMFGAGFDEEAVWDAMTDPANGISEKYREKGPHGGAYLSTTIAKARDLAVPAVGMPGPAPSRVTAGA